LSEVVNQMPPLKSHITEHWTRSIDEPLEEARDTKDLLPTLKAELVQALLGVDAEAQIDLG
jgi:hypothetical protein